MSSSRRSRNSQKTATTTTTAHDTDGGGVTIERRVTRSMTRLMAAAAATNSTILNIDNINVKSAEVRIRKIPASVLKNMKSLVFNRLGRELDHLILYPPVNCTARLIDDNILKWEATICGPTDSPYEDGTFMLQFIFPETYPFRPPEVRFLTKIYHCNIGQDGRIGLNVLGSEWSPALRVLDVISFILTLLAYPNPLEPLEEEIAKNCLKNLSRHDAKARKWTKLYAKGIKIEEVVKIEKMETN